MSHCDASTLDRSPMETQCRHHWVIDAPSGPTSKGMCLICGEVKEFANAFYDADWEDLSRDLLEEMRLVSVRLSLEEALEESLGKEEDL